MTDRTEIQDLINAEPDMTDAEYAEALEVISAKLGIRQSDTEELMNVLENGPHSFAKRLAGYKRDH